MALIKRHPTTSLSTSELPGQTRPEKEKEDGETQRDQIFYETSIEFFFLFQPERDS